MGGWPRGDAFVGSYFNAASKKGGGAGGGGAYSVQACVRVYTITYIRKYAHTDQSSLVLH